MKTFLLVFILSSTALGQWTWAIDPKPTLAPVDCYCGVSCPCPKCECNVAPAKPKVSVLKPEAVKKTAPKIQPTIDPLKYSAPNFNACPDGQCHQRLPAIKAVAPVYKTGVFTNNCPNGQCTRPATAQKASVSERRAAPMSPVQRAVHYFYWDGRKWVEYYPQVK